MKRKAEDSCEDDDNQEEEKEVNEAEDNKDDEDDEGEGKNDGNEEDSNSDKEENSADNKEVLNHEISVTKSRSYTTIKAGYRITIDSWEGDLDFPDTVTMEGYSREEAQFVVEFCKLFSYKARFANIYECSASEMNALGKTLAKLIIKHQPVSYGIVSSFGIDEAMVNTSLKEENYDEILDSFHQEWFGEFFGRGNPQFPRVTRVCERIKVEYIPQDILIEDVSKEFGASRR